MKKTAIACAFFFLSFHATAQTYLSCDFENGIPNSFVLKDYDGNTPSEAMAREGFSVGTPWIAVAPDKGKSNHVAASTSWYNPAGTSDDWMTTPSLTLTGSHPQLQWTAKSSDKKHRDGYEVYISTNGGTELSSGVDSNKAVVRYTVDGRRVAAPVKGINILKFADGRTVKVLVK